MTESGCPRRLPQDRHTLAICVCGSPQSLGCFLSCTILGFNDHNQQGGCHFAVALCCSGVGLSGVQARSDLCWTSPVLAESWVGTCCCVHKYSWHVTQAVHASGQSQLHRQLEWWIAPCGADPGPVKLWSTLVTPMCSALVLTCAAAAPATAPASSHVRSTATCTCVLQCTLCVRCLNLDPLSLHLF